MYITMGLTVALGAYNHQCLGIKRNWKENYYKVDMCYVIRWNLREMNQMYSELPIMASNGCSNMIYLKLLEQTTHRFQEYQDI